MSQTTWQATLEMMLKSERPKRGLKKRSIRKGGNRDTVRHIPEMFLIILSSLSVVLICSTRITVKENTLTGGQPPVKGPNFRPFREFPDGPCYSCGAPGHWRSQCTAKFNFTKQQPFKLYVNPPFFNRAVQGNIQEQEKTGQP